MSNISITEYLNAHANELITAIRDALVAKDVPNKGDIEDLLQQIKEEVSKDVEPHRGLLIDLKVLCQAGSVAIPLVTALMELLA